MSQGHYIWIIFQNYGENDLNSLTLIVYAHKNDSPFYAHLVIAYTHVYSITRGTESSNENVESCLRLLNDAITLWYYHDEIALYRKTQSKK